MHQNSCSSRRITPDKSVTNETVSCTAHLNSDGDHSPTEKGREAAPLRKRAYMKTHERSDKRSNPHKVETEVDQEQDQDQDRWSDGCTT